MAKPVKRSRFGRAVSFVGRIVVVLVLFALVMVAWGLSNVYAAYNQVRENIEQIVDIDIPEGGQATRVYARDYDPATEQGTLLGMIYDYDQNRMNVEYQEIPPKLLACLLSIEDNHFFDHGGVDINGTVRAVYNILRRKGEIRGGGSTITQQLSRNVFLPYIKREQTLNRKIQEYILAGALEKRFTKQEILEAYLNHIYLGGGAYGVSAAAQTYFDKDLDELTLAECALIAGLPQTPGTNNPFVNMDAAIARRGAVLELLKVRLETDFFDRLIQADPEMFGDLELTETEINEAIEEPITLAEEAETQRTLAPYFVEYIRHNVLYKRYGQDQVLRQGLIVVTTIDPQFQEWAEELVKEGIDEYRESKRVSQGALVLVKSATGEVLACVGGYEWLYPNSKGEPDKLNRALQSSRPVGSSFKPFTYATAYEQGFPPGLTIWDGPNEEMSQRMGKRWPTNSDMKYLGWISMFYALQMSRNAASVDLLVNCTGAEPVIETARKMGITAKLDPVPSLTLGAFDIKPVEMAEAFATFPNMGEHVDSILVKRVYSQSGIPLEINDSAAAVEKRSNRAFSENTAWTMVQNMRRVVEHGTGYPNARVSGLQLGGKTGTNDDYADAWFVGYSPELACAIWVGNDDYGKQMNRMFGGNLPAQVFGKLMKRIYFQQTETVGEGEDATEVVVYEPKYTQREFQKPPGATFNGFPGAQVGKLLEWDEEGNLIVPEEMLPEEEQEEGKGSEDDFYNQWEPPIDDHVFF